MKKVQTEKCEQCQTTVYFAERATTDGKIFHTKCMGPYLKTKKVPLLGRYPGDEDRIACQLKSTQQAN